jgi:hypothetical protein
MPCRERLPGRPLPITGESRDPELAHVVACPQRFSHMMKRSVCRDIEVGVVTRVRISHGYWLRSKSGEPRAKGGGVQAQHETNYRSAP